MHSRVYTRTEEGRTNLSISHNGKIPWNKGVPQTEGMKFRISISRIGKYKNIYNPNWKGGKKLSILRTNTKRRELFGFIPLNDYREDGWVGHHIDKDYVVFILEELHRSVWHSVTKDKNMDLINDKVYEWFIAEYLEANMV